MAVKQTPVAILADANILFKEIEANIQEYESLGFFDLIFILAIM
jgi:hypothetical protein